MRKSATVILSVLLLAFLGLGGFCIIKLYTIQQGYHEAAEAYMELSQEYMSFDRDTLSTPEIGAPETYDSPQASTAPQGNDVLQEHTPLQVNFADLKENTSDEICAWIYCPDTRINYPVVQHSDNKFYLNADAKGQRSSSGAIFLDAVNFSDFRDRNNILHGHHMNDGSMFASLSYWQQETYWKEHPVMYLNTSNGECFRVDLFAAFTTPSDSDAYRYEFSGENDVKQWLLWLDSESKIHPDITFSPDDRFLTLSTCGYAFEGARTILLGRMTPVLPQ